jgi:hypothetical protein
VGMEADQAAQLFKLWAANNGYISKSTFAIDPEPEIAAANFAPIEAMGVAAQDVFHDRGILFVAYSETVMWVIVYTDKRLRKKYRELCRRKSMTCP